MKIYLCLCCASLILSSFTDVAQAASIGVNLGANFGTLSPADVAGATPYAQSNYNNVTSIPTNLSLRDSTGALTIATLTTSTNVNFTAISTRASGPDEIFNNDRVNSEDTSWSFTLNNIPYDTYSIVVYDMDYAPGAVKGISAGGVTFYTKSPVWNAPGYIDNNLDTPFTYTQGTSTNPASPTPLSNFVVFTQLHGGSQTVTIAGGFSELMVGGFQIVQTVPEPSTWLATLTGGVGGLIVMVRRRFRSLPAQAISA